MKEEDKKLLLKDLIARLPYGVKIALKNNGSYHHDNVAKKGDITIDKLKGFTGSYFTIYHNNPLDWDWYDDDIDIEDIKPYLFPLSSMTAEQEEELKNIYYSYNGMFQYAERIFDKIPFSKMKYFPYQIEEFFNRNHFDYRGLIKKGLAIDSTNKNIY